MIPQAGDHILIDRITVRLIGVPKQQIAVDIRRRGLGHTYAIGYLNHVVDSCEDHGHLRDHLLLVWEAFNESHALVTTLGREIYLVARGTDGLGIDVMVQARRWTLSEDLVCDFELKIARESW